MKRFVVAMLFICCLLIVTSCDHKYPYEKLAIQPIQTMKIGEKVEVEVIYPTIGVGDEFRVKGWKDTKIEIIKGKDIVSVDGMTITALKPGKAVIKVSTTTIVSEEDIAKYEYELERVYSVKTKITVQ